MPVNQPNRQTKYKRKKKKVLATKTKNILKNTKLILYFNLFNMAAQAD
jgi:hypothetical protein